MTVPNCYHDDRSMILPPGINHLSCMCPGIPLDYDLDRSIRRCKLCDLLAVEQLIAANGPHRSRNSMAKIERDIILAEQLIRDKVRSEELLTVLPMMKRERLDTFNNLDSLARSAWSQFWSVWGMETEL